MSRTASSGESCKFVEREEPKLRHEFVALMFAIAAGEVGLQVAGLIAQPKDWHVLLPAYSHLLLATVVIAASWVGWTVSPSPGGRKDVTQVLEVEFIVLLIDVACVICYFILVRQVESHREEPPSAGPESECIFFIFLLYLIWDIFTKIVVYLILRWFKGADDEPWCKYYGPRFLPTIICLALAIATLTRFAAALSAAQVVLADSALLMLVLLFRALKDNASLLWPKQGVVVNDSKRGWSVVVTLFFLVAFSLLYWWALYGRTGWLSAFIGS